MNLNGLSDSSFKYRIIFYDLFLYIIVSKRFLIQHLLRGNEQSWSSVFIKHGGGMQEQGRSPAAQSGHQILLLASGFQDGGGEGYVVLEG